MKNFNYASGRILLLLVLLSLVSACTIHQPIPENNARTLEDYYRAWQGTPYRLGGGTKRGLDCSAFVQNAYREVYHLDLPRNTRQQAKLGRRVTKGQLAQGDLVFFKTGWRQRHVGIYMGNNEFIHASPSKGVMTSNLADRYWRKRFWKARDVR